MNKDKLQLRLNIDKARIDAKYCLDCGNYYIANELEKRISIMVKDYEKL